MRRIGAPELGWVSYDSVDSICLCFGFRGRECPSINGKHAAERAVFAFHDSFMPGVSTGTRGLLILKIGVMRILLAGIQLIVRHP